MNQELQALLGNLGSITEQIKQLMGGEEVAPENGEVMEATEDEAMMQKILKFLKEDGGEEEEMVEKQDDEEVEKSDDDETVEKEDADMSTASDDAEDRIEDQPEMNLENVEEVAKAIVKALKNKKIRKSRKETPLNREINNLKAENKEMKKALEGIFEGLGIADEIKKSQEVQEAQKKARPMHDNKDVQKTLDFIKDAISSKESPKMVNTNNNTEFRKSLIGNDGELLKGIFTKNK